MATKTTTIVFVVILAKPSHYDVAVFDTRALAEKFREQSGDDAAPHVYERAVRKR